jgi:hypothetical protein
MSNKLLCKKISSLEHKDKETIYLIIKSYMIKFDKTNPLNIPYDAEILSSNNELYSLSFDMKNIPENLVKILNIFVKEIIKKK